MRFLFILLCFPLTLAAAFSPQPVTPYPVLGYQEIPFFDTFQQVDRQLLVWYPVEPETTGTQSASPWDLFAIAINAAPARSPEKKPIIILSHGYTGNPHQLSWLIRELVHEGFIVVGMQHRDLIDGQVHVNHWQRAKDVSVMIDQLSASSFAGAADLKRIALAGYSLGGTTAIWVAGGRSTKLKSLIPGREYASLEDYVRADEALPTMNKEMMAKDWQDVRVKAIFVMAPAWAWLFDEESLQHITIPTYIIAAAADQVLVTRNNAGFFARQIPKAVYQEIPGKGGHFLFISALNDQQQHASDPTNQLSFLFKDAGTIDRRWIQFQVAEEAVRFFKATLQ